MAQYSETTIAKLAKVNVDNAKLRRIDPIREAINRLKFETQYVLGCIKSGELTEQQAATMVNNYCLVYQESVRIAEMNTSS